MAHNAKLFRLLLSLGFMLSAPAFAKPDPQGVLTLYRWDVGQKAQNLPALETKMSESEAKTLERSGRFSNAGTYRGCYLAQFSSKETRLPASAGKKFFRVCHQ